MLGPLRHRAGCMLETDMRILNGLLVSNSEVVEYEKPGFTCSHSLLVRIEGKARMISAASVVKL